ncbi:MAG: hypothetical protein K2X27_16830, partial [Candidatus Obscuribacterales bacterium]|nr:hypothetical protein [Candidatus Obscuribacterales bacterium]
MAMDSGDMLRQLLEKFSNETALIEEEYKLIHEQISQLEQRLAECQEKQGQVLKDRERVLSIRERYLNGKFEAPQSPNTAIEATLQTQTAVEAPKKPEPPQPAVLPQIDEAATPVKATAKPEKAATDATSGLAISSVSAKRAAKKEQQTAAQPIITAAQLPVTEKPLPAEAELPAPEVQPAPEIQEAAPELPVPPQEITPPPVLQSQGFADILRSVNQQMAVQPEQLQMPPPVPELTETFREASPPYLDPLPAPPEPDWLAHESAEPFQLQQTAQTEINTGSPETAAAYEQPQGFEQVSIAAQEAASEEPNWQTQESNETAAAVYSQEDEQQNAASAPVDPNAGPAAAAVNRTKASVPGSETSELSAIR